LKIIVPLSVGADNNLKSHVLQNLSYYSQNISAAVVFQLSVFAFGSNAIQQPSFGLYQYGK
jgi:hypothetical protein